MSDTTLERKLPCSPEAERSMLGAVLLDPAAAVAFDIAEPGDFHLPTNRCVARKMAEMVKAKRTIDLVTLLAELGQAGELDLAGGAGYVSGLVDGVPRISNVRAYAGVVKNHSLQRRLIHTCNALSQQAFDGEGSPTDMLDLALQEISSLAGAIAGPDQDGMSYRDAAVRLLRRLDKQDDEPRVFTGVGDLDRLTGGFRGGELVLFTAETGVGKTLLAQQTRRRACSDGLRCLFASAEMMADHLVGREVATEAELQHWKLRRSERITPEEMGELMQATAHECNRCRILDGSLSLQRIRLAARQMKAQGGLDCLFVDYDELVDAPGKDEFESQRNLVRGLKGLAIELGIPVILISQLRKLLTGEDRQRPTLQRLYGGGAKTKHSSIVVYLDREYVRELHGDETEARICILKNRDGRVGGMDARFNVRTLRFESCSSEDSMFDGEPDHPALPRGDRG